MNVNNTDFEECINDCLKNSNLKKEDISLNLHSDFGAYQKPAFQNSILDIETGQTSSILVNTEIAIQNLSQHKYIALTAKALNGTNYCMILSQFL